MKNKDTNKESIIKRLMENEKVRERLEEEENKKPELPNRIKTPIRKRQHSIGNHPALPESDDYTFEEKMLTEKYRESVKNYKKHHDVDDFSDHDVINNLGMNLKSIPEMEQPHRNELQEIAVDIVRKEYDIPEDEVIIETELMDKVEPFEKIEEEEETSIDDLDLEDEEEKGMANQEVHKRRFINCLIQGAAYKGNHMFHMCSDKIDELNPRLSNAYSKLASETDYDYLSGIELAVGKEMKKNLEKFTTVKGGDVEVEFPQQEGDKPVIRAKGLTFPILVHEIVKGAMEVLSSNGLPDDEGLRKFVIDKADKVEYEPWDLLLGPCIWEQLLSTMSADDVMDLKQYVYSELVTLPADEFNDTMREILGNTKKGRDHISKLSEDIRNELEHEDYEKKIEEYRDELGGTDDPNDLDDL